MTVQELIDHLQTCDRDAIIKILSRNILCDATVAISGAKHVVLSLKTGIIPRCQVCRQPAVAAPYHDYLICQTHWSYFKGTCDYFKGTP